MRRLLVLSLALLLLVVPTGAAFAGKVPIGGGRELYLKCRGSGSPTVVLEAGLRNTADVWSTPADQNDKRLMVYQGVGRFTRVCAYDRPGTTLPPDELSRSTPVRQPRTTTDAANDLHRLIVAARLKGPFVLVGHSTGGLIIRRFAAARPQPRGPATCTTGRRVTSGQRSGGVVHCDGDRRAKALRAQHRVLA